MPQETRQACISRTSGHVFTKLIHNVFEERSGKTWSIEWRGDGNDESLKAHEYTQDGCVCAHVHLYDAPKI